MCAQTEARAIALKISAFAYAKDNPFNSGYLFDNAVEIIATALAAKDANIKMLGEQMVTERLHGYELLEAMELADGVPDNADFGLVDFPDLGRTDFTVGDLRAARRVREGGADHG